MDLEITRRGFLKTAGVALAGAVAAAAPSFAQEKAQEKQEKKPEKPETKEDDKKTEEPKEKKDGKSADDADWDAAWKNSGTEETRTCPQCGATMYRQGRTWTCNNCGYSYVE